MNNPMNNPMTNYDPTTQRDPRSKYVRKTLFHLATLLACTVFMTIASTSASAQPPSRTAEIEEAIKATKSSRTPRAPVKLRPKKTSTKSKRFTPKKKTSSSVAQNTGDPPAEFETGVEYKPVSPRTKVTFNLEDADLPDLVRLISNMTGKRFILPGKIRSIKATVFAPTKVSAGEAYNAFLSILNLNGLTVVPAGRYLKIVETGGVETQPLPTYADGTPTPRNDRYITRLHHLKNISAEDVSMLLGKFKSREGSITVYAPSNMLIITDTGTQIRRMLRLVDSIDVSKTGTQTWIEPIHFANAVDLATRLQEIFPTGPDSTRPKATPKRPTRPNPSSNKNTAPTTVGANGESSIHNILADERTNSLIIIATERAYLRILEMIRQLDVALEGEGRVHVHYVQHSAAEDIANAINQLIGGGSTPRRTGKRQAQLIPASSKDGDGFFEGDIRVTSYEPSNALLITASLHDYSALKRVIEKLDAPRRQVFIEAVIMELSISRSSQLGLSYHGGISDFPTSDATSIFGFEAGGSINPFSESALTGLALGVSGPTLEGSQQQFGVSIPGFGIAIQALAESGDTNVISTPHIIAMDNVEAEITVGANIPLQTSGISLGGGSSQLVTLAAAQSGQNGQAGGLGALAGLGGSGQVQRQDIGTTIKITPHINENNEIRLEIEEEISEAGAPQGTLGVIPINRRAAKTEVMVRDQQTIVIGGLMRDRIITSETKIPILGDLPILGALFRQTTKSKEKTNLVLFLTPYIIRNPSDLRSIFERKMQERQEFLDRHFVFSNNDYETPIDYSRTRGLVTEIINEIDDIDEEKALMDDAASRPEPEHTPRDPIGSYVAPSGTPDLEAGDVVVVPDGEEIEDAVEAAVEEAAPVLPSESPSDAPQIQQNESALPRQEN